MAPRSFWMRFLSAMVLLGSLFSLVVEAQAQDVPITRVSRLNIDLWPEYDRPAMLVIYRIVVPPEIPLPSRLSLRIPQRAGRPNAVATAATPGDMLVNAPYEYQPATGSPWAWIHVEVNQPYVQIEYYDPALERDGDRRTFTYTWPGDVAANQVVVQIQQPWNASPLTIQPPMEVIGTTDLGLQLYEKDFGPLETGQALTIDIEYTKPDEILTVQQLQAQQPVGGPAPGSPAEVESTSPGGGTDWLPWVLIGAGVVALLGAGWFWWQGQQPARPRAQVHKKKPRSSRTKKGAVRFCPSCGTKGLPGARYCHHCGAPLPS